MPPINDYIALVIAYRDHELISEVLARLATQTVPPTEVVIVDNGGTLDDEVLAGLPLPHLTRLISRPDNPGYGAAVNEARGTSASALLVLTHDAVFDADLAKLLLRALEEAPESGAAAPLLRFANERTRVFSAGGRLTRGGRALHHIDDTERRPHPVDWVDGAIVLYRRESLDAIGWLAEQYFLYFEDVDTAWRMRRAGLTTLIVPEAVAFQQPGAHPMYLGIRNMTLFARTAQIPLVPHLAAVSRRVAEEGVARILRRRSPELVRAARGWWDGRRGRSGKPTP